MKRGLLISSGGAWGAYGGGVIAALNKDYDIVAGISTGALISPFAATKDYDLLKEAYTSVTTKDILDLKWYKPNPITKDGKANIFAILYALAFNKKSIGTAYNMRKLIDKFLLEEQYYKLINKNKSVIVGSQNLREKPSKIHYFNILDCEFEDFKDWMWASAVAPFFCNLVDKEWIDGNGNKHMGQWTDGGVTELIALDKVIDELNIFEDVEKEIDIIIHRPQFKENYQTNKINNLINNVDSVINAMRYDIEFENILQKIEYISKNKLINVNIYYLPRKISNNSLIFKKDEMTQWWEEGYNSVKTKSNKIEFKS